MAIISLANVQRQVNARWSLFLPVSIGDSATQLQAYTRLDAQMFLIAKQRAMSHIKTPEG
jgi:hypothetical protein